MRITTDVNYAGLRTAGNVSSRTLPATGSSSQINQLNNDVTAKLQHDRAMIDALTIAQSSRVLVQKAMDISARLRTIAFQAMTSGTVNTQELSTEMAGIQGAMQTYGEIVSIPVSSNGGGDSISTEIYNRMSEVASGAEKLSSGEKVDPEVFSRAGKAMSEFEKKITTNTNGMVSALGVKTGNIIPSAGEFTVTDIGGMIRNNPDMSLTAQANINPETVRTVIV